MKVILKKDDHYCAIYHIKVIKSGVIGYHGSATMWQNALSLQNLKKYERHFFYPFDTGKFHYSSKYFEDDFYCEKRAYYDIVQLDSYLGKDHVSKTKSNIEDRENGEIVLLRDYQLPKPADLTTKVQLPCMGFNNTDESVRMKYASSVEPKFSDDDILVDLNREEPRIITLTVGAFVGSRYCAASEFPKNSCSKEYYRFEESGDVFIELYALIT